MPDNAADSAPVDPERDRQDKPFDRKDGTYGLDYDKEREAASGAQRPSGTVGARPGDAGPPRDPAMPPENGRRASFDPATGAVHGSGSGAGGGGNPGEDFESDPAAGDGYPITGGEGLAKGGDTDLGPPDRDE
ncbi:hypothetical protein FHT00_001903 [Sphingomonas insulae]|uniref:Translation initiation factor n=1 Tax=Sphingomonas insulae TaxID=424800 RepID=A0ABP3T6L1_9SPHN|nr:hypothetical protein [Sphingomonas insulae]NIJ29956.1 hypothetical protein [Sphingomonas insulae]